MIRRSRSATTRDSHPRRATSFRPGRPAQVRPPHQSENDPRSRGAASALARAFRRQAGRCRIGRGPSAQRDGQPIRSHYRGRRGASLAASEGNVTTTDFPPGGERRPGLNFPTFFRPHSLTISGRRPFRAAESLVGRTARVRPFLPFRLPCRLLGWPFPPIGPDMARMKIHPQGGARLLGIYVVGWALRACPWRLPLALSALPHVCWSRASSHVRQVSPARGVRSSRPPWRPFIFVEHLPGFLSSFACR